jgi:pyridoxal 5'-phosphate synthase pdxS subunit
MKAMNSQIAALKKMNDKQLSLKAKEYKVPFELVSETAKLQRLPVVNFAAGGIATPADASLMMQLGCDGIFVGSGIFKSSNPSKMAKAIVQATTHYNDPRIVASVSEGLGDAMKGLEMSQLDVKMADRGN